MSSAAIDALLNALSRRTPIDIPVAVVAAHPDDETVGAGASLSLLRNLRILHVTDGAPRNLRDARAAGFATCGAYAAARQQELRSALQIGGVPEHVLCTSGEGPLRLPIADQTASDVLAALSDTLRATLSDVAVVITHAYEGGHPDHDSVAFAVQRANLPAVEMTGYHAAPDGRIEVGRFTTGKDALVISLTAEERQQRNAMLDCFATQRATLGPFFGAAQERFRPAPRYDFTQPPASRIYYDGFDWGMTSARWCERAAQTLQC